MTEQEQWERAATGQVVKLFKAVQAMVGMWNRLYSAKTGVAFETKILKEISCQPSGKELKPSAVRQKQDNENGKNNPGPKA